jgi:hypothetical protein
MEHLRRLRADILKKRFDCVGLDCDLRTILRGELGAFDQIRLGDVALDDDATR